jgi:hypothetical protein
VLVGLEAILVLGAIVRIHDGHWAPLELTIAAIAAVVAVLLIAGRPEPDERRASTRREPAG